MQNERVSYLRMFSTYDWGNDSMVLEFRWNNKIMPWVLPLHENKVKEEFAVIDYISIKELKKIIEMIEKELNE